MIMTVRMILTVVPARFTDFLNLNGMKLGEYTTSIASRHTLTNSCFKGVQMSV